MSLGSITHKINVNATDDSYKMTRDKMKVVEEERKEVRYATGKGSQDGVVVKHLPLTSKVWGLIPSRSM